jgi:hypothetical protein
MGAGTNVQDRLIALHHLDVPWRPSDIEQQEGRILRQGNLNPKVRIFRYVTEGTFDSYSWQVIENKQKFIGQIMTSKSPVRSCEDVDEAALSYAEVKALATGNPYIKEKMDLDIQVSKLKLMKANHTSQKYRLEDNIVKHYPKQIAVLEERISGLRADIQMAQANIPKDKELFSMRVGDKVYSDKKEAGTAIIEMCKAVKTANTATEIGEYGGFRMVVAFDFFQNQFRLSLKGKITHDIEVGTDAYGNITRINNKIENMGKELSETEQKLENVQHQLETAKQEVDKPFAQEAELAEKSDRLNALNALLNMDEKGVGADCMEEETQEKQTEVALVPLNEWMTSYMLPDFMEQNNVGEEQAKEMLADAVSEECENIYCLADGQDISSKECMENPAVLQQIADYVGGNYFAVESSVRTLLIFPQKEENIKEEFGKAVQTISQSVKIPGETLSQVIFFYNRETQKAERYISPANAGRELTAKVQEKFSVEQPDELRVNFSAKRQEKLFAVGEKEQKYGGQINGEKIVARAY